MAVYKLVKIGTDTYLVSSKGTVLISDELGEAPISDKDDLATLKSFEIHLIENDNQEDYPDSYIVDSRFASEYFAEEVNEVQALRGAVSDLLQDYNKEMDFKTDNTHSAISFCNKCLSLGSSSNPCPCESKVLTSNVHCCKTGLKWNSREEPICDLISKVQGISKVYKNSELDPKVIERILLGLPLEGIILIKVGNNGNYDVIKGTKTLQAIYSFIHNEGIILRGLNVIKALNGVAFQGLPTTLARKVNNYLVPFKLALDRTSADAFGEM